MYYKYLRSNSSMRCELELNWLNTCIKNTFDKMCQKCSSGRRWGDYSLFAYVTCNQIHPFNVWLSVQTSFGATKRNSYTSDFSVRKVGCALVTARAGGRAVARCELLVRSNCVAYVPFSASAGGNYRTSRDKLTGASVNAPGFLCVKDCGYNAYKHTFFKSAN